MRGSKARLLLSRFPRRKQVLNEYIFENICVEFYPGQMMNVENTG
jgi:hypothetical protein